MQGSYSATYSTGCDKPVCTRATLWRQHYITTSKEYLTNSHILSIYFELAFLQLHLIKILCKLIIIWVNYERNKKGAIFYEHRVYKQLLISDRRHCVRKSFIFATRVLQNGRFRLKFGIFWTQIFEQKKDFPTCQNLKGVRNCPLPLLPADDATA